MDMPTFAPTRPYFVAHAEDKPMLLRELAEIDRDLTEDGTRPPLTWDARTRLEERRKGLKGMIAEIEGREFHARPAQQTAHAVLVTDGPCGRERVSRVVDSRGNIFEYRATPAPVTNLQTLTAAVAGLKNEVGAVKAQLSTLATQLGVRPAQVRNVTEPRFAVPMPYFES